eukprot:CAMPEP_0184331434 /NCGR_PEP_ID=MMETSP1089-20130417/763_1 /TAXON_ID=38269 ORGANISM="Gloeochaete wittrockiana, Strain SAG46.84" /NCGR_SAMPLE_ID=MMETSP1089 /ASSEMBLY_ACC=CAM_ASM_000445 /LENGTH=343 /DNA_ID=CAMNT_0026654347 /DNA_START=72 /DNA_END=1100 /DNA_ORIENTATION=-
MYHQIPYLPAFDIECYSRVGKPLPRVGASWWFSSERHNDNSRAYSSFRSRHAEDLLDSPLVMKSLHIRNSAFRPAYLSVDFASRSFSEKTPRAYDRESSCLSACALSEIHRQSDPSDLIGSKPLKRKRTALDDASLSARAASLNNFPSLENTEGGTLEDGLKSWEEVVQYVHVPIEEASRSLGMKISAVRSICRKYGIKRWPYRRIECLKRLQNSAERNLWLQHDHIDVEAIESILDEIRTILLRLHTEPSIMDDDVIIISLRNRLSAASCSRLNNVLDRSSLTLRAMSSLIAHPPPSTPETHLSNETDVDASLLKRKSSSESANRDSKNSSQSGFDSGDDSW